MLDQLRRRSSHPHQVWGIHALSRKCFVALEAQRKICYKSSTQKLVCIWRARPEVFANCIKVEIEWISLQTVSTDCVASSCPHLGQIRCRFRMPCIEPWHIIKHGWKRPCIKKASACDNLPFVPSPMFKAEAQEMPQAEGPGIQLQVLPSEMSIEHVSEIWSQVAGWTGR